MINIVMSVPEITLPERGYFFGGASRQKYTDRSILSIERQSVETRGLVASADD